MPNSVQPCGQQPTRFLHPQDSPGKNTRVGTVPANWALWQKVKKNLIKVKKKSEKVGLKLNIQKTKIMASGPITSWEINEETVETVSDFIFWGSKITADGDYSREIKRCLLLGRKNYDQPRQRIKKQSHYFANKGPSSQSYVFFFFSSSHVWMWELNYKEG